MIEPIRFGIIGFGRHAEKRLAPAFARCEISRLTALHKRDPGPVAEACRRFDVPLGFTDPAALAASDEVDAVIVASPPALHREHFALAAMAGKAVLVEKPLAVNSDQVETMAALAGQEQIVAGCAFVMRHVRAVTELRELLRSGGLGDIRMVTGAFAIDSAASPRSWIDDPEMSGGGPMADLGSHLLDLTEYLLDRPARDLKALVTPGGDRGAVERQAAVTLQFGDGILGQIQVSFDSPFFNSLEVWGERGRARIENFHREGEPVRLVLEVDGEDRSRTIRNGTHFSEMIDGFAAAVAGAGEVPVPLATGIRNQRLLDRVYGEGGQPLARGR